MKKNSGKQAVINFIGQHPGCSFQDIRRGTGLESSVVNSSLWQMNKDGQVKREGECRSFRYTLIDTTAATESTSADFQFSNHHCGANKLTNLFNQCLAGVRK
ncbi:MarR family transcriptional regulator [Klebsiella michiganensis]|uniref:MarR family transcriptional regulator n=1 Tax=Klebsiella michiganensis TaxID=1134687 RepID=UPI0012B97220|nr:helix-turn-helix domain-containing protein [Klebsiella michiganensis]